MKAKTARRLMSKKPTVLEGVFQDVRHVAQQGYDSMYILSSLAEVYKDELLSLGYSIMPGDLAMYRLSWRDNEPTYFYEPQIKPL